MNNFKEEQKNVVENYEKSKRKWNIFTKFLIGIAISIFVVIIYPLKTIIDENYAINLLVVSIILFLLNIILSIIFAYKEKMKVLKILYITNYIFLGLFMTVLFCLCGIKIFVICILIVTLIFSILSVAVLQIKNAKKVIFVLLIPAIYLIYKYVNIFNPFTALFIINVISYIANFKFGIKSTSKEHYDYDDIMATQIMLSFLFLAQMCCLVSLV